MDVGPLLFFLVAAAMLLAIVGGGVAARLFAHAADQPAPRGGPHDR
ncbi:MAG: hypothetical protein ABI888_04710 [Chloroflexota bacterium]